MGKPDESARGVGWLKKGGRNMIKEGEESGARVRESIMHSNMVAFHSGTKENSTIHQTNTSNGSFHTALFSHKSLKALHSQQRGLEDTLCRIRLYI